jgi:hypothetical protein
MKNFVKVCSILLALIAALAIQPLTATAQQASHPSEKGFAFAVYGDSRSMMYLPYKQDEEPQAREHDQELVFEEKRLRDDGTDAARTEQPSQGGDQMDKKNGQIAHRRIVAGREILRNCRRNNNSPGTPVHNIPLVRFR